MSFAVSATNLLLLYLSIEFLSITSYILAGFLRTNKRSAEAGLKYFLYGSEAAAVMLYGMSLLYGATGSLDLGEIAQGLAANAEMAAIIPAATLLTLVGLGFKASLARSAMGRTCMAATRRSPPICLQRQRRWALR